MSRPVAAVAVQHRHIAWRLNPAVLAVARVLMAQTSQAKKAPRYLAMTSAIKGESMPVRTQTLRQAAVARLPSETIQPPHQLAGPVGPVKGQPLRGRRQPAFMLRELLRLAAVAVVVRRAPGALVALAVEALADQIRPGLADQQIRAAVVAGVV